MEEENILRAGLRADRLDGLVPRKLRKASAPALPDGAGTGGAQNADRPPSLRRVGQLQFYDSGYFVTLTFDEENVIIFRQAC